jgi:hypothetical protein
LLLLLLLLLVVLLVLVLLPLLLVLLSRARMLVAVSVLQPAITGPLATLLAPVSPAYMSSASVEPLLRL